VPVGADWTPLSGGRTNAIWKVEAPEKPLVVKLFSGCNKNPLFPNDGVSEANVLRALNGMGIAPSLVGTMETALGFCIVYEHVVGHSWRKDGTQVARLLSQIHRLPERPDLRTTPSGSDAIQAITETILAGCSSSEAAKILAMKPLRDVAPLSELCLIHGDVVPNNVLVSPEGLRLIDWQCPSIGDPCEDIAVFLSPAMQSLYGGIALSSGEQYDFLEAYENPKVSERYTQLAPWFHWRMAAYCLWKAKRGAADYADAMLLELAALEQS
jgi:thiamine kinase